MLTTITGPGGRHGLDRTPDHPGAADPCDRAPAEGVSPAGAPPVTVTGFGRRLRVLRIGAGLSQNALAIAAGVDPAYVNRLEHAVEASPLGPSRSVVVRLWLAVSDEDDVLDALLADAGLLPESIVRAGGWDTYLRSWRGQVRVLEHKLDLAHAECRRLARVAVRQMRGRRGTLAVVQ